MAQTLKVYTVFIATALASVMRLLVSRISLYIAFKIGQRQPPSFSIILFSIVFQSNTIDTDLWSPISVVRNQQDHDSKVVYFDDRFDGMFLRTDSVHTFHYWVMKTFLECT